MRGLAQLFCPTCHERIAVAWSCKERGFCAPAPAQEDVESIVESCPGTRDRTGPPNPCLPRLHRALIEIQQPFASYRLFLDGEDLPGETREKTKLYVYVLPGGRAHDRNEPLTAFVSVKATTIDTDSESVRQAFPGEFLTLGRATNPEMNRLGKANLHWSTSSRWPYYRAASIPPHERVDQNRAHGSSTHATR